MSRGRDDEDDIVAGRELADAMDDQRCLQRPAIMGFGLNAGELLLGHAGVVFEFHRCDPRAGTCVPHQSGEGHDRADAADWPHQNGPLDVILLEGWCVGATPQAADQLTNPINALEADQDPDGIWRGYVNRVLADEYQTLFARLDRLIMLKVPNFEMVRHWRRRQEHKLRLARPGAPGLMDDAGVDRFIMFYERLTRHLLATLPDRADLVCRLDEHQRFVSIDSNEQAR